MKSLLKFISIIIFTTTLLSLYSCKKNTLDSDSEKPYLSIVEPMANDTTSMAVEPEIHIEFTATDNTSLKTLVVTLKDSSNNVVFTNSPNVDGLNSYLFHQHYEPTITITGTTLYKATITATDNSSNVNSQDILFYVEP